MTRKINTYYARENIVDAIWKIKDEIGDSLLSNCEQSKINIEHTEKIVNDVFDIIDRIIEENFNIQGKETI